jgi:nucleoside-diphosphate-sugar epimerase
MVSINQLADLVMDVAGKKVGVRHIPGPEGVRGRNSHNALIGKRLGWKPSQPLRAGIEATYPWIAQQVELQRGANQPR